MRPAKFFYVATAVVVAASADLASATQFALVPQLREVFLVNDNIRLNPEGDPTVYGALSNISLTATAAGELYAVEVTPRASIQRYGGDSTLDREDYYVDATGVRLFERSRVSLALSASDISTLTSEEIDSVIFVNNISRISLTAAPQWTYSHSERLAFTLNALASDVNFENSDTIGFVDYRYYSGGGGITYSLSDRTTFSPTLTYSLFETPEAGGRNESISWQLSLNHAFSETANATVSMGHVTSNLEFTDRLLVFDPTAGFIIVETPGENRDGGALFTVDVEKEFDRLRIRAEALRELQPSSQGVQTENIIVRGSARWEWTQNTTLRADFSFQERSSQANLNTRVNQTLYTFKAGLGKTLTKRWRLETEYQYRQVTRANGLAADFNALSLVLIYRGAPPSFPVLK